MSHVPYFARKHAQTALFDPQIVDITCRTPYTGENFARNDAERCLVGKYSTVRYGRGRGIKDRDGMG